MSSRNAVTKISKLALAALAVAVAGCATAPAVQRIAISELPDCFVSNYDAQARLFTIKDLNDIWADPTKNPANQQCLLMVAPGGTAAAASGLSAGRYTVYLANGGGGGAGGTLQSPIRGAPGGGGGGGGAGAADTQTAVYLSAGSYRLTIGAGGPGGRACAPASNSAGGPGWYGSPSNIVRVATGEMVAGVHGADMYVRPTVYQHEKLAGTGRPGQGGFGPGQTSGGAGARPESAFSYGESAKAGAGTQEAARSPAGIALGSAMLDALPPTGAGGAGDAGSAARARAETQYPRDLHPIRESLAAAETVAGSKSIYTTRIEIGAGPSSDAFEGEGTGGVPGLSYGGHNQGSGGGGGGASNAGDGGNGGGENLRNRDLPPVRGSLGSGGGGGEGTRSRCDPGARGGNGYIAFRRS